MKNFGNLPKNFSRYENSKIVILPVPFEKTTTWLKGCGKGPKAIIEASHSLELYDIETDFEVFKLGICTEKEISAEEPKEMIEKSFLKVKNLIKDGKFVVSLGGEHSISIGMVKAQKDFFPNLSVLQLDAHADSRDSYLGSKFNHACAAVRIKEIIKNLVAVGIRSLDSAELNMINRKKTFFAEKIKRKRGVTDKILKELSKNVYLTIDLDVFDPSIMPSVGTPEPGGLDWYFTLDLLKDLFKIKNVVGFDVVELCPTQNKAANFLAAKLIYKLLSYKFFK